MGYFIGTLLERKVKEYDLEELDQKLASLADGSDMEWPSGGYGIPAIPAYLESTRIVLYSMLHHHGLKQYFTVKTNYSTFIIYITQRQTPAKGRHKMAASAAGKRTGSIFVATDSEAGGFTDPSKRRLQDIPPKPEDLSNCFTDDISFDPPPLATEGEK